MRAGVVLDGWKLSIFERHLTEAGYSFQKGPGVTSDTVLLTIETDDNPGVLGAVLLSANEEALLAECEGGTC